MTITITNQEVRINVDSRIEPFARILRDTHLPKNYLIRLGSNLIQIAGQLYDVSGIREVVLTEIGYLLLCRAMEFSIVLQKGLEGHAKGGATATLTLSSE